MNKEAYLQGYMCKKAEDVFSGIGGLVDKNHATTLGALVGGGLGGMSGFMLSNPKGSALRKLIATLLGASVGGAGVGAAGAALENPEVAAEIGEALNKRFGKKKSREYSLKTPGGSFKFERR